MPPEYRNKKMVVICNDCLKKSVVPFHIIGGKCKGCRSYNTARVEKKEIEIKLIMEQEAKEKEKEKEEAKEEEAKEEEAKEEEVKDGSNSDDDWEDA